MESDEPVWITGVGAATPLGCGLAEIEANLLAGRSGVTRVTRFPTDDYPSRIAAQIGPIPAPPGCDPAAFAAPQPAGSGRALVRRDGPARRRALGDAPRAAGRAGARHRAPSGCSSGRPIDLAGGMRLYDPEQDRESTIERTRRDLGLSGPALALSAACASGNHALEIGRHWLRLGLVDVCVAGACDLAVTPIGLATFGNLRALSRRNDDPAAASRPFDRGRDGFVLGEGGVAFVLERSGDARRAAARTPTPRSPAAGPAATPITT